MTADSWCFCQSLSSIAPGWKGQLATRGFKRAGHVPKHMNPAFTLSSAVPQMCFEKVWQGRAASHCCREQNKCSCSAPLHPTPASCFHAGKGKTPPLLYLELMQEQLASQALASAKQPFWSILSPQQWQQQPQQLFSWSSSIKTAIKELRGKV